MQLEAVLNEQSTNLMEKSGSKNHRSISKKDPKRVSQTSHFLKPRSPAASTFSKDDGKDLKSIVGGSKKSSVLPEEKKITGIHKQPLDREELDE